MTDKASLFAALSARARQQHWLYIYPVLSRRAEGISLGINLHPNQVCNWQCIYCQVSGLHRGQSPYIDLMQLERELTDCLEQASLHLACSGETMQTAISDIAFAGDGEPCTSPQFAHAMQLLHDLLATRSQRPGSVRLISNGSQMQHADTQAALRLLQAMGGEVWFKLDAGNDNEMRTINDSALQVALHLKRLAQCAAICRTRIQTAVVCRVSDTGEHIPVLSPSLPDYLSLLESVKTHIAGVLLYGISRPSQQAAGASLRPLPAGTLRQYAEAIAAMGISVSVYD